MAVEFKDYYKILGVERTADDKTIKSAYRKLARKYHPDVAKGKDARATASRRSTRPTRSSPIPRSAGATTRSAPTGSATRSAATRRSAWRRARRVRRRRRDFSDFFRTIFGDLGARRAGARTAAGWRSAHQPRGPARRDGHAPVGSRAGRPGRRRDHAGGGVQRRPQDLRVRGRRTLPDLPRRRPRRAASPARPATAAAGSSGAPRRRREDPGRRATRASGPRGRRGRAAAPGRAAIST